MERHITVNLSELEVQGKSNSTICIKWSPKEAGSWRDVLQLTDNRRIKYDVVIATTAKDNKKSCKIKKRLPKSSLMKTSNFSVSTTNRQFYQNNTSLKIPTISQPLIPKLDAQTKEYKLKYLNDLNKENIFNKISETETSYAIQKKENRINGTYNHDEPDNVMFEQNTSMWDNGTILPQVMFSTNEPQDIRRVTYIKEKRSCSNVLYECNGIVENTACDNDKIHSEISVLLNKFTFTPTDVISSSPEAVKKELAESTSFSQSSNKQRTFNISHNNLFETSVTYDTKTLSSVPSQSAGLHNLSPIKSNGCSLISDIKDLIASSPIAQHYNVPKDSNEFLEHIKIEPNVQMSPIAQHCDVLKDSSEYLKHKIEPSIQITNRKCFSFEIIPKNDVPKKIRDMYIEISPPKKHSKMVSQYHSMSVPKLNGTRTGRITKNKTLCEGNTKKLQLNIPVASEFSFFLLRKTFYIFNFNICIMITERNTKNVAAIKVSKLSLIGLNKTKWNTSSFIKESSYRMQNKEESFIYETFQLDPFAPSTTEDPFLKKLVTSISYFIV